MAQEEMIELPPVPSNPISVTITMAELPHCPKCNNGFMLPMCEESRKTGTIMIKGWVCNNPECLHNLMMRYGDVVQQNIKRVDPKPPDKQL